MAKVDLTYLESVAAGDADFIKQMLEMFTTSTLPEMEKLESYHSKKDWIMVSLTAHKIKAPVQMLGQSDIAELIVELEKSGKKREDMEKITPLVKSIKEKLLLLNEEVEKLAKSM